MIAPSNPIAVLISAHSEWRAVMAYFDNPALSDSPYGGYFEREISGRRVVFVKSGWGKISAAASTQFAILTFDPGLLINLGTCGGIAGRIAVGETVLVDQTLVYDIYERMGDAVQAVERYTTRLDLSFLCEPLPQIVRRARILSADQDIDSALVEMLVERYGAVAADWESGAIAWTADRNRVPCLILRSVTDLVSPTHGETYNNIELFHERTEEVMTRLLETLPAWIKCAAG